MNPSGFEITTSTCLWTLVAIFALERRDNPPRDLVLLLAAVASVDVLIRGLSPLWVALAGLSLVLLVGPRAVLELFKRRRDVQIASASVLAATLLAMLWIFTQGTLNILPVGAGVPKKDTMFEVVRIVSSYVQGWLRESVGILGWLDTELPNIVYQSWYLIVLGILVVALVRGTWWERGVIGVLSALVVIIPVTLVSRQAKILGVVWQGRDGLPLAVGALIMAAAVCGGPARPRARRALQTINTVRRQLMGRYTLILVVAVVGLANLASFYTNLRRYAVGRYGPKFFFLHHQGWSPPTGQFVTLALYSLTTVALAGVVMTWIWYCPRPSEHTWRAEDETANH